jgi:hypothetical protein
MSSEKKNSTFKAAEIGLLLGVTDSLVKELSEG